MNLRTAIKNLLILLTGILISSNSYSQQKNNFLLAEQHFIQKEYDKAIELYSTLYNKNSLPDYRHYLQALQATKQFNEVEKILKKELKKYPEEPLLYIEMGYNYKLDNNDSKANSYYEKTVKNVPDITMKIKIIADAFVNKKESNFALLVYEKGKKYDKFEATFYLESAEIYQSLGQQNKVFNEMLDLLETSSSFLQTIQIFLQESLSANEEDYQKLNAEILRKIQKNPNEAAFSELLIWSYVQQKKFNMAILQAKAIDKRLKEDGNRLYQLANICATNNHYDAALEAYKYVLDKGLQSNYYFDARKEILSVYDKKITTSNYTKANLQELDSLYNITLQEMGSNYRTIPILNDYGKFQAFYLDLPEKALKTLTKALEIPNGLKADKADTKIIQADVYIYMGELWESSLLYSQVEKDFAENPIGHEAKLKNAKLSYYRGEFKWAQAQLDVLKASTSKLIANDALELSLLIQDNTLDSNNTALEAFSKADLLVQQNKSEKALLIFDSLLLANPTHSLADDILYKKAEIMKKKKDYSQSTLFLEQIITKFKDDILADNALFELAELNENYLNNPEKAMELYKQLMTEFPGSVFVVEARKQFRKLRGDAVN